jgi:nucleoside-diphosphate-sugar epimerase
MFWVAGASGLVGHAAVRLFASLPDYEVVAISRRAPDPVPGAKFISADLLDQRKCAELFSQMDDVTQVVHAAVNEKPGLMNGWLDREQMQTNLVMLQNLFEPLEPAARNLQHVTLLQGTKAYGAHLGPIALPARERSTRHPHENFYWLQDYVRAKQPGKLGPGRSCGRNSLSGRRSEVISMSFQLWAFTLRSAAKLSCRSRTRAGRG